ncbi:hypothetical protein AB0395_06485 [Streptosporangium sp. NPDC051023]|uniref:hypothetical protein n=1 Tax=Streptosporangium sp. NPDC051023 TaxID=3155410 RepID=UPI003450F846
MSNKSHLKAATAAAATAAALIAVTPGTAQAAGNCTHYGQAGYGQVFTDSNYSGDCWEFQIGVWTVFPVLVNHKVSSLRSWAAYSGQQVHLSGDGLTFTAGAGEWWASLPGWFNDKANAAY